MWQCSCLVECCCNVLRFVCCGCFWRCVVSLHLTFRARPGRRCAFLKTKLTVRTKKHRMSLKHVPFCLRRLSCFAALAGGGPQLANFPGVGAVVQSSLAFLIRHVEAAMEGQVAQVWVWAVSVVCVGCPLWAALRTHSVRTPTVDRSEGSDSSARRDAQSESMACRDTLECYFRSDDVSS